MKKTKYAKVNTLGKKKGVRKFGDGGDSEGDGEQSNGQGAMMALQAANRIVTPITQGVEQSAFRKDGSVNSGQYATGQAIDWGMKGASAGAAFGPWGALIGGGAGLIGGSIYGVTQGNKINREVNFQHQQDDINKKRLIEGQDAARLQQEQMYSKAYYNSNPTYGTKGANLFRYGGNTYANDTRRVLFPYGGEFGEDPKKPYTKEGWDAYNTGLGYKPSPYNTTSGGYKSYYDPKMFDVTPDPTRQSGYTWKSLHPEANVDTYNVPGGKGYYTYQQPVNNNFNTKPVVTPTSTNTRTLDSFGHQVLTDKVTGNVTYLDKFGNPLQGNTQPIVSNNAMGGYARCDYGGSVIPGYAPGGYLKPIADDTVKAEGASHAEGGIDLKNNGKTYAEIEGGEVVKDTKVYSDRLKMDNGKTYAQVAEKLGKQKGKFEEKAKSFKNIEKNTGKRMVQHLDNKLEDLFNHQEITKEILGIPENGTKALGGTIPLGRDKLLLTLDGKPNKDVHKMASGGDWANAISTLTPYLDNAYNAYLINQTPQVPIPTTKVAYNEQALPLNTKYNIDPALNAANTDYRQFRTNVDQNVSSSVDARGNKLAAFSNLLTNKGNLYGNKENIETQLKNQDLMNTQGVLNRNIQNSQDIANTNLAQTDKYNWAKVDRTNNMLYAKSANVANATEDAMKGIQDKRMSTLDDERIMTDALKYQNGAGFARLVGSTTMDNLLKSNPSHYKTIEKALKDANQTKALADFYKKYGKLE